jgi:DNA-binding NarL/FixJ family response regulator
MKQVADILHLVPRTVTSHKYETMEELALKSTAELI